MSCNCKVIKGPAAVAWGGVTYVSQGDITIRSNIETFEVMADYKGKLDARLRSLSYTVSFAPVSTTNTVAAVLQVFNTMAVGTDIFRPSGSDQTLVITPLTNQSWSDFSAPYTAGHAGKVYTFKKAALTGLPSMKFSTGAQLLGDMTFTCIRQTGVDQGTNESFWSMADWADATAASAISAAGITNATVVTAPYMGTWAENLASYPTNVGATNPWYNFDGFEGFNVSFDRSLSDVKSDNCGFIGSTVTSLTAKVTCIPCTRSYNDNNNSDVAGSYEQVEQTLLNDSMFNDTGSLAIGDSLAGDQSAYASSHGGDNRALRIYNTASLITVDFLRAALTGTGIRYGSSPLRQGEVEWTCYPTVGGNLMTVTTT